MQYVIEQMSCAFSFRVSVANKNKHVLEYLNVSLNQLLYIM
jgi:hypothetical protein